MKHPRLKLFNVTLFCFLCMMPVATLASVDLPGHLQDKIEQVFPGAKITKTEEERYQGQAITEVELVAKDGTPYEVYLSKDGKVLKIEKEDEGFLWFK
ncbi:PepSY domain-containing protein [Desulfobacula toluolica]|uniref:PepSY domain-containing protein n=1 Tax=Desulfobacula toluolica (strain DSM 7467 / Tol2) TaxID=651182 RepID=K0NHA3_DESTT|nr:hypothetical protein [Desulfobacula toluolica]CCK80350.1 uncharacterized protein TOL2_C21890 [Desulfobacula toluolica Tol2]